MVLASCVALGVVVGDHLLALAGLALAPDHVGDRGAAAAPGPRPAGPATSPGRCRSAALVGSRALTFTLVGLPLPSSVVLNEVRPRR